MNTQKFDKILESARAIDRRKWEMGDAMLELPRSVTFDDICEDWANDPDDPFIIDEEDFKQLKVYEKVSRNFPKEKRNKDLCWEIHAEVGSPALLEAALKIAEKEKVKVDLKWIKEFKKYCRQARKFAKEMEKGGTALSSPHETD